MVNFITGSLKVKLVILFLLIGLTPIAVVGYTAWTSGRQTIEKSYKESLTAVAESREISSTLYLRSKIGRVTDFGSDGFVRDMGEKINQKGPDAKQLSEELSEYLLENKKPLDPELYTVHVMDLNGNVIASTDLSEVGQNKLDKNYFIKGKEATHIKDVYYSTTLNKIALAISTPLRSPTTKEWIGVIVNRYHPDTLNEITVNREGLGETGECYIVNKDGFMITESRFIKDAVLKQKVDTEPVRLFQAQKKIMTGIYPDYRGMPVLGASMGDDIAQEFPYLGWTILAEIDVSEAFSPIKALGLRILLIAVAIAVLVGILAWFVASGISMPILQIADRVSSSAQQLSSTAQEMNATTEEVSSTVQQIAKGSETTAQRVEETSKVMEQMNASVTQVATSAQLAASVALQANQTAQKGGEAAKDAINKMTQMAAVVVVSAEAVKKLSERSEQISEITNVITDIADQTNLLALNAAIEAARAGEQGRGFAVVAEEVRKLAEGSAKAADQIGKLIKDVQKETTQAVSSIEGMVKETGAVKDIARRVAEDLDKIIKNAEGVASQVEQVSVATEQMSAGTKQVVKSVDDIASTAEEAASATEEASASTEEMTASMQEMAASAQELADMAIDLRALVTGEMLETGKGHPLTSGHKLQAEKTGPKKISIAERLGANRKRLEEARRKSEKPKDGEEKKA